MSSRFTPEGKVKAKVKAVLNNVPGIYYWMPVPAGYGENSLDIVGCHRGRFFAIETKAPGKTPGPIQQLTIKRIVDAGGAAFVIDGTERAPIEPLTTWLNRSEP